MATKTPLAEYSGTFRVMASGDTIPAAVVPTLNQNTTGSAATLTTARTINGTSFNGSANITTSTWGTARTLTIGNTGKSVNGSTNYSWTLAEIGAASNDALSNNWPDTGGLPGCTNANSPTATWCAFGDTATNTPYAGYGTLWTFNTSTTGKTFTPASGVWLRQFAFTTNGFFYSRVNINNSGWTTWVRAYTTADDVIVQNTWPGLTGLTIYSTGAFYRNGAGGVATFYQPRMFVQSGDPGAEASDGDLWVW